VRQERLTAVLLYDGKSLLVPFASFSFHLEPSGGRAHIVISDAARQSRLSRRTDTLSQRASLI